MITILLMKRLSILLVWTSFFLVSNHVAGQNSKSFLNVIENHKKKEIDSLLHFSKDKNKLEYLAVLPSFNYNFFENSFNVGISLSNLANFYQTKQRNKIELERLKFQLNDKKEKDIAALDQEYALLKDMFDILKLELENTTLAIEIFNLKKAQYDNNKITLEEWLNVQKNNQDRNLLLFSKNKSLATKMRLFEEKIKNNCFLEELKYLATH